MGVNWPTDVEQTQEAWKLYVAQNKDWREKISFAYTPHGDAVAPRLLEVRTLVPLCEVCTLRPYVSHIASSALLLELPLSAGVVLAQPLSLRRLAGLLQGVLTCQMTTFSRPCWHDSMHEQSAQGPQLGVICCVCCHTDAAAVQGVQYGAVAADQCPFSRPPSARLFHCLAAGAQQCSGLH
jgi:hypothetical protein